MFAVNAESIPFISDMLEREISARSLAAAPPQIYNPTISIS
jgi:hypothetical protein